MELNPIACDNCRSRKCKCDRHRPSCLPCRNASLVCRYQEGGRRGLPVAYINTLEKRLQETEAALYAALLALEDQRNIRSGDISSLKAPRELSKLERQDEWKNLPLQTNEQLVSWFQHKHQQAVPSEPDLPHIPFPGAAITQPELPHIPFPGAAITQPGSSQVAENPRSDLPVSPTSGTENTHSPTESELNPPVSTKSIAEQLRGINPPQAPNTSTSPSRPARWHNYF